MVHSPCNHAASSRRHSITINSGVAERDLLWITKDTSLSPSLRNSKGLRSFVQELGMKVKYIMLITSQYHIFPLHVKWNKTLHCGQLCGFYSIVFHWLRVGRLYCWSVWNKHQVEKWLFSPKNNAFLPKVELQNCSQLSTGQEITSNKKSRLTLETDRRGDK